jgi:futalosine hydrolase
MPDLRSMRIAIAAATSLELDALRPAALEARCRKGQHQPAFWTTGVGMLHTTHTLTRWIREQRPDLVVQAGIGGTFDTTRHPVGSVVAIRRDAQADLGVMETDGWRDVFAMGFADPSAPPYRDGWLVNPHTFLLEGSGLPQATGVTVNRVSSDPAWIESVTARLLPDLESMEGAALHFVCLSESVPFLQIRGVSNAVGVRDKSAWRIREALEGTRLALEQLFASIPEIGPA